MVIWGGVNDYGRQTARETANNLRCMVDKAKKLGARVVLATEISSQQIAAGDADKNALNAVLRAEAFGWGGSIIWPTWRPMRISGRTARGR